MGFEFLCQDKLVNFITRFTKINQQASDIIVFFQQSCYLVHEIGKDCSCTSCRFESTIGIATCLVADMVISSFEQYFFRKPTYEWGNRYRTEIRKKPVGLGTLGAGVTKAFI